MWLVEISQPPSFEPEEWERHKRDARAILWQRVLAGQLAIHHGYLAGQLGLYPFAGNYFSVLDSVCVEDVAAGGPMVTALVTRGVQILDHARPDHDREHCWRLTGHA